MGRFVGGCEPGGSGDDGCARHRGGARTRERPAEALPARELSPPLTAPTTPPDAGSGARVDLAVTAGPVLSGVTAVGARE
ncbi:hypothetical protein ACFYYH_22160 [Streptomyces sp. NPDC002018]|uniref:hypothetical protein n=1 Tax=Streptomyces sp. NPDC002018 TaxID=3364629 RepID=UPI003675FBB4